MTDKPNVFDAARDAAAALEPLDQPGRKLALKFVAESLDLTASTPGGGSGSGGGGGDLEDETRDADEPSRNRDDGTTPTPKAFLASKEPKSKSEEIACLAYYLKQFRDAPHFKPQDIVKINTEAQGNKFDQPSRDIDNTKRSGGMLTSGPGGTHQLNRLGEHIVEALPDRAAVQALRRKAGPAKRAKTAKKVAKKRS